MEESIFEKVYQERLEERIIAYISECKKIPFQEAMDLYYNSYLADKIATGSYGMQYLDYKVLAQLILQTIQSSATE
ncbi:MAG: hypothetical protein IJ828_12450 [Treponema sp.]|nr:hypothetical protein [Treponema sp.]